MNKNKKSSGFNKASTVLMILIPSILIVSMILYFSEKDSDKVVEPEKIYIEKETGETLDNFNKKSAVEFMTLFLNNLKKDVEGKNRTLEERLIALDSDEIDMEDVLNKETIEMLHLHSEFKDLLFNRQFTSSALLTYAKLIEEATKEDEVTYSELGLEELVYFDPELRTAHIPMDIFTGDNRGVAFEVNYIDGEWKFTPYTSIMSLVMMVNYEERFSRFIEENKK